LQKTIAVRAIPDTYMVRIVMEGTKKDDLADIVNAITTSFLETTRNEQIYGSVERQEMIEGNSMRLRKEIDALELQRVRLAELLGLTTFGESTVNPFDVMLAQAREKLTSTALERAQAEAALQAFLAARETPASMGRSILEMRQVDSGLLALSAEVVKRSEELGRVVAGLEDGHPAKKPAQDELDAINKRLHMREAEFEKRAFENINSRLQASVSQTMQVEAEVQSNLRKIEAQAISYATNFQQAMRITNDIRKREQELKDARDRLNFLQTEKGAIGFVRLVSLALPPDLPMGTGKTKLILMAFAVACVLALVAPVALDMLDRRIYTVNDAEKLVGIPAAGWQLEVTDLASKLFAGELNRRFASTLLRNKMRSGNNVFAFASVNSMTGASAVILDTAAVLQQLGVRVLVVDANNFAPSAELAMLTPGFSDFLCGQAGLDAIHHTVVHEDETLTAVGIGQQIANGLRRLDRVKEAVQHWSAEYDLVLIDLPPILLSADSELLIQTLGQVFMVLEAQAVSKGEVTRAKRILTRIDPDAVGLFVTRIPLFHGAGYMSELMVETIARRSFSDFMSLSSVKLQIELWRAAWTKKWNKKSKPQNRGD
jgi:Mrp family chromosome partitioning ATPase